MRKILLLSFVLVQTFSWSQEKNYAENSIIVKLKANFNNNDLSTEEKFMLPILQNVQTQFEVEKIVRTGNPALQNTYVITFSSTEDIDAVLKEYSKTNIFEFVEPNYTGTSGGQCMDEVEFLPNEPLFPRQWGLKNNGTFPLATAVEGADIKITEAWDIETGDPNMIIAVLDSGVNLNHPQLAGRLWKNSGEVIDGIDNDNNGYIDDVDGYNFAYGTNNVADDWGHGSNIAGLLGSIPNDGVGYAGINWASKIMPVKMLNQDGVYLTAQWAIDALYYAVNNGAKVINMSFGGSGDSTAFHEAVQFAHNAGCVMTVSMMNFNNDTPYYPAAYAETIAVGSIDPDGNRSDPFFWDPSSGSNYGPHIDLIAPGNYTYGISGNSNTNYGIYWGGTSQAAPHVAGIASLLLARNPTLTPEQVRTILRETADDQTGDPAEDGQGFDVYYGYGRLNALSAINNVLGVEDFVITTNEVTMYPNPINSEGILNIKSISENIVSLKIYNVLGTLVKTETLNNARIQATFNLSQLANGVYMVEVFAEKNKQIAVKKVVVNK